VPRLSRPDRKTTGRGRTRWAGAWAAEELEPWLRWPQLRAWADPACRRLREVRRASTSQRELGAESVASSAALRHGLNTATDAGARRSTVAQSSSRTATLRPGRPLLSREQPNSVCSGSATSPRPAVALCSPRLIASRVDARWCLRAFGRASGHRASPPSLLLSAAWRNEPKVRRKPTSPETHGFDTSVSPKPRRRSDSLRSATAGSIRKLSV
jgi:hypothetical protein